MKGKAVNSPNMVIWANGFKSNMPDWPTARQCAVASDAIYLLHRCQLALFDRDGVRRLDESELKAIEDRIHEVLSYADLGIESEKPKTMPLPPGF